MPETDLPFVEIVPGGRVDGSIRPPGSKSLTNRALICAAFAEGSSCLTGALRSEDTEVMIEALRTIGVRIEVADGGRKLLVDTLKRQHLGSDSTTADLFIANSGTSVRFLAAALSAAGGNYRLHGVDRMHERPIGDLIEALAPVVDGRIEATSKGGCPPVLIASDGWSSSDITVAGSVSSQYLSGLMMAAPVANRRSTNEASCGKRDTGAVRRIGVMGELVSRPYVDMTAGVMRAFGSQVEVVEQVQGSDESVAVAIGDSPYHGFDYAIEPDASAASYFWAVAAITGGEITVLGLSQNAMQGDVGFCDVLEKMGCKVHYGDDQITVVGQPLCGVDIDMNKISDTVQTLSVVALFAKGPTRVRGVAHNRFKETDRIGDLACELRKLGATVQEHEDGMTIVPLGNDLNLSGAQLETYHDHRMAMSLSLAGLRIPGVQILNPACTSKTYPEFFADLEQLIGRAHRWAME